MIMASRDALVFPIVSDVRNDIFLYVSNVVGAIIILLFLVTFGVKNNQTLPVSDIVTILLICRCPSIALFIFACSLVL